MLILCPKSYNKYESGFSLLEVLIVLAILGTLLSLVSVNFSRSISQARFAKSTKLAIGKLQLVRVEAALEQKSILVITDDAELVYLTGYEAHQIRGFQLANQIRITGDPIEIGPSGFCSGGELSFHGEGGRFIKYSLKQPDCMVVKRGK